MGHIGSRIKEVESSGGVNIAENIANKELSSFKQIEVEEDVITQPEKYIYTFPYSLPNPLTEELKTYQATEQNGKTTLISNTSLSFWEANSINTRGDIVRKLTITKQGVQKPTQADNRFTTDLAHSNTIKEVR